MKLQSTVIMAPSGREHLQQAFDEHPSLAASLEDFESSSDTAQSPTFQIASQHSGFRSGIADIDSEPELSDSNGPWSPPAWRRPTSGWFQHNDRLGVASVAGPYRSPARSRESSPLHDSDTLPHQEDPDLTLPAEVPLPGSPTKHRSPSPSPGPQHANGGYDVPSDSNDESNGAEAQPVNNCRLIIVMDNSPFGRKAILIDSISQILDSRCGQKFSKEQRPSRRLYNFGGIFPNQRLRYFPISLQSSRPLSSLETSFKRPTTARVQT